MKRRHFKIYDGNFLHHHLMIKSLKNSVGHVGFIGIRGSGRNTLCERFGQLGGGDIQQCERKAFRSLIIDHSQESAPLASLGNRKTLLFMHVIFFSDDGVDRDYVPILQKLKGMIFMFDVTKVNSLEYARECLQDFKNRVDMKMPPYIFVGNKVDKRDDKNRHHIYYDFGRHLAHDLGARNTLNVLQKDATSVFLWLSMLYKNLLNPILENRDYNFCLFPTLNYLLFQGRINFVSFVTVLT
ncbi:hypothetical protein TNIN_347971 [Trichonephila inaurata madagascariensis]|uniref:Uncharacterized protein n=1 Tax=Trichonephila inaurata madagascariensis TaxID=2747483 RepID=A0A8X7CBF0_9ARAC|nr:hypothetical protein TNIN_347971 [Trichonephila inaurata madagascariensis]